MLRWWNRHFCFCSFHFIPRGHRNKELFLRSHWFLLRKVETRLWVYDEIENWNWAEREMVLFIHCFPAKTTVKFFIFHDDKMPGIATSPLCQRFHLFLVMNIQGSIAELLWNQRYTASHHWTQGAWLQNLCYICHRRMCILPLKLTLWINALCLTNKVIL